MRMAREHIHVRKGVTKNSGGAGFADVWKRGYFALEYKSKHKNLDEAYQQFLKYREALESPPLLVVCDLDRFDPHELDKHIARDLFILPSRSSLQ